MKRLMIVAMLVGGCSPQAAEQERTAPAGRAATPQENGWAVSADGGELAYWVAGAAAIRLTCPKKDGRLIVSVPAFRPIGSEERFSLGSGETIITLVADSTAAAGAGVTAEGPQPEEIKKLLFSPLRASYGAQSAGPYPAVPVDVQRPFVQTCSESANAARAAAARPTSSTHPCDVQDGELLRMADMRAIGTEPFWNARTKGRCVTYSTPEEQAGTRIWTKVGTGPMGPIWAGTYQGKPFILRVQPAVGCSDGMSDRKYDWSASLTVAGEERKGCAERP
jgi:uncharacterized membrane protein